MKHFVCMQIFHRHEPRPILSMAISQSVSRTRRLARPRGGGPGSGLGSGSGTGADRPFRIVKSETMKRVDHKR